MLYCWIINHHKTTGIVKNAATKSLYVFMADNNVNNEPLVMNDSQGHFWTVICW